MKSLKKILSVFLSLLTILSMCSVSMPVFAAYDWKKDLQQIDDHYVQEEFSSKIVAEIEELREENTKHFLCEDGSYIATTYSEPVHYKENGEWKEIDNTLKLSNKVKSSSGKAMYVPKSTDAEVKIPQSFLDGQKISLTKKGHTISFGVSQDKNVKLSETATVVSNIEELSSNVQPDKAELYSKTLITSTDSENYGEITEYNNEVVAIENQVGAIVYENVFESADLEYVVTTNSIKENIVIYEKQNDYTYKFDMDFGDLVPIVNEDNSIRVVDPETEETVFFVGAPYMYDANDIESTDVDISLVEEAGIYLLTLKASSDWINATERTFPVVIDPIVYLSFDDVFVMNGLLNKNTTKVNKELRVGRNLTNLTRTYIKPNYPTNIPMGSYIDSAYLVLGQDNYYQAPGADGIYINLYDCRNVSSWDPGSITWENQPFYNADNGYLSSENCFLTSVLASSNKAEYNFNITASAKRWLRTGSNDGLMLASSDESEKTQIDFYSSRTSDSSLHPSLSIYYIEPSISTTSWETDSQAKEGSLFRIATDNAWTAYSNENWISLSKTSGNGLDYSKIIVTANNSIFDRVGTVTVKMGDTVIGTITVTQYGKKPNLELDTTALSFNAGSSKQTVNITSNTTWSFSNLPEWITVTPSEGSMNSTVEIEVSVNNDSDIRESNITVTADTVIKTINVAQLNDIEVPVKPDIYEEDGLVYISSRSFGFNKETDSPEHIEYKIENGEWTAYDGEPLNIVRTYGAKVYARVRDDAENISPIAEITLENNLGEYTASYTDIALGEGLFPVEFGRTYTSTNGWFFTFDANIVKIDDNAYVFTGFYGEKQYFIKNSEGKYFSIDEDELTVNSDSYVLTYGDMICTFGLDGKINRIVTDYLDTVYNWSDNSLTLTNGATVTFTDGKPTKINIARTDSEGTEHTKEIEYVWVEGNLTRFIDAADVEHNYAYTNKLLSTNETETITYSAEGRVKLISQPNGAFVKYTYNDNATNAEVSNNVGAVTVSDSKGVTDIWYYADGVYISNIIDDYSDKAVYAPNEISDALTQDSVVNIFYVVEGPQEDEVADAVNEEINSDENETTDMEYPLHTENVEYNPYGSILLKEEVIYESETDAEPDVYKEEYLYDVWNQCIGAICKRNSEVSLESTEYDILGRTLYVEEGSKTTEFKYSGDYIVSIIYEDGEVNYTYDNNKLINKTDLNGVVTNYEYDSYGNLLTQEFDLYLLEYNTLGSVVSASVCGTQLIDYEYDSTIEQKILKSNFGNGQSIVYDYNEEGEITAIKLGEVTKYGYEYLETTDDNDEVTKEWTELTDYVSGIKKVIEENELTVNDLNGNFIYSVENVSKDEEVEESFNGAVTTIGSDVYTLVTGENKDTFNTNGTTDFTKEYTYVNDELSKAQIAGITTSYGYNAEKLISALENTLNDVSQVYGYAYDDNGNITIETLTTTSKDENGATVETNEAIHYTYDDKEQLIYAETSSIKYEYTYDDRGNILTKKEYSISLDENNQKVYTLIENGTDTYTYDGTWKDKLISYNGQSVSYDAVGNPINYMGNELTWTMGRQLASFGSNTYTYNEDGIRTSKTVNGVKTTFLLDGYNIIEQTDGTTTLHFFYDSNNEVIGFRYNGENYFYVKDAMSDIIAITDSNKNIVAEYRYDPWGKVLGEDNLTAIGNLNPFRYRGYYYDNDIKMYYLQSRYYDVSIGRFINEDVYFYSDDDHAGYNMFVYCSNNPVNCSDESGYSKTYTLSNGWKYRIDSANSSTNTQKHIHIWKGDEEYSQNDDGSPHDGSSGSPPKSVREKIKDKAKWDWDSKSKSYEESKKMTTNSSNVTIAIGEAVVTVSAIYVIYRCIRMIVSLIPPLWWTAPINAVAP